MKRKSLLPAALLLAIAGTAIVGALFASGSVRQWTERELLAGLKARIAAASDDEAIQLIDELEQLDAAAVPLLVQLLANDREPIAHAAQQEIDQLLDAWQQLPASEAARRHDALAHCLADGVPRMPMSRQPTARRIAVRMLALSAHSGAAEAHQFFLDCETILRLATAESSEPISTVTFSSAELPATQSEKAPAPVYQLSDDSPVPEPPPPATPRPSELPQSPPAEPRLLEQPPREQPPGEGDPPGRTAEPRRFLAPKAMRIEG